MPIECDFCVTRVPYADARFLVACVVCDASANCCFDCWLSVERNYRHCRDVARGPLRRIIGDIQGNYVERRKDADEEDDTVVGCKPAALSVYVGTTAEERPLAGALVELLQTGDSATTPEPGIVDFGLVACQQPTLHATKRHYVAPDGQARARFSFADRGMRLTRATRIALRLDCRCPGNLTSSIKLANSEQQIPRSDLTGIVSAAAETRRPLQELLDAVEALRREIDTTYAQSMKTPKEQQANKAALADLDKFLADFGKFYEESDYDPLDKEEALNASIALVETLLRPPREPSLLEKIEEREKRLRTNIQAMHEELEAHEEVFAKFQMDETALIERLRRDIADPLTQSKLIEAKTQQIARANARLDTAREKHVAKVAMKNKIMRWHEEALEQLVLAAKQLGQSESGSDTSGVEKVILAADKALSSRPTYVQSAYDKPKFLNAQFLGRLEILRDRRERGPIIVTVDVTWFSLSMRRHYYTALCTLLLNPDATMGHLMAICDVWSRRTGAANDETVVGVHEVDAALVNAVMGITEVRIKLVGSTFKCIGGGGLGEKVFAVGIKGALNFRAEFRKREERFYALLLPLNFTNRFGYDVRARGRKGASAREPDFAEFRARRFDDPKQGSSASASSSDASSSSSFTTIQIPDHALFLIRGEESTSEEGQVTIHFGFRAMRINGEEIGLVEFLRRFVLGVVEFDREGRIVQYFLFPPP